MDELLLETMPSFARLENGTTELPSARLERARQPGATNPRESESAEGTAESEGRPEPVLAVRAK